MSQTSNVEGSSWAKLQGDFELRNTVEFAAPPAGKRAIVDLSPPALPSPTRNRKILLILGVVLAVFDVFILPIVFFYSLTYASNLTPRYGKPLPHQVPLRQWLTLTSHSVHCHNMSLLYDDLRTLHASMHQTDIKMLCSIWPNWMAAKMASGT